jgi:hypothetical protein
MSEPFRYVKYEGKRVVQDITFYTAKAAFEFQQDKIEKLQLAVRKARRNLRNQSQIAKIRLKDISVLKSSEKEI